MNEEGVMVHTDAVKRGLRNIKYTFLAQLVVMGVGVLKTLLIPSFLSVESYGYWQLYLFYLSYIGFFYLGFNDGILLKYGKYDYNELPLSVMRTSIRFYLVMLLAFSIAFSMYAGMIQDAEKRLIMGVIGVSILMYGINGVLVYIFLITNQIKLYSIFTSIDQVAILVFAVIMLISGQSNYQLLIVVSFVSKLVLVIAMIYLCKELFLGKTDSIVVGMREFADNIKCGLALMLAQIMGMLLTGLGKVFIEYSANITEYAYYSFGISVINIIMICVTAFATVMYPMLSRVNSDDLPRHFYTFCNYVTAFNTISLIAYFPAAFFVKTIFPQYTPVLEYLFILFALLTWQAKTNIVINPYFRVLRKERSMLNINAMGVLVFIFTGLLMISNGQSIKAISYCTFLSAFFIELVSEFYLRRQLNIRMSTTIVKDIVINIVFIICCSSHNLLTGAIFYIMFVIAYLIVERKIVINILRKII